MHFSDFFVFSLGTIPISILSALLAVWGGVEFYAKKRLDLEFSKHIEQHKAELQQIRDQINFDLGRKMKDFDLYTTKRHQVYPELLGLFLVAGEKIGDYGNVRRYNISDMTSAQLQHFLVNVFAVPEEHYRHLVEAWESNRVGQIDSVYATCQRYAWVNMLNAIIAAHNKTLLYELYCSEEVAYNFLKLTKQLKQFTELLNEYLIKNEDLNENAKELKESIESLLSEQKDLMRKELGLGYYNEAI